ncbi:MAG: hypothetical protein HYZ53_09500 [Planctomycetes bacterium]|nr:hypothetical protein [Planctomycetota bacterium]
MQPLIPGDRIQRNEGHRRLTAAPGRALAHLAGRSPRGFGNMPAVETDPAAGHRTGDVPFQREDFDLLQSAAQGERVHHTLEETGKQREVTIRDAGLTRDGVSVLAFGGAQHPAFRNAFRRRKSGEDVDDPANRLVRDSTEDGVQDRIRYLQQAVEGLGIGSCGVAFCLDVGLNPRQKGRVPFKEHAPGSGDPGRRDIGMRSRARPCSVHCRLVEEKAMDRPWHVWGGVRKDVAQAPRRYSRVVLPGKERADHRRPGSVEIAGFVDVEPPVYARHLPFVPLRMSFP